MAARDGDPGRPAIPATGRGPGVLVIAGGDGETALLRESCARLAHHGFVARGLVVTDEGAAGPGEAERARVDAALRELLCEDASDGRRLGIVGFGRGGLLALDAAARHPRVGLAVCCDGAWPPAALDDVSLGTLEGAVLALFAERGPAVEQGCAEALARRLREEGGAGEVRVLPGVEVGYLDPDRPDRYDADRARSSWDAALARLRAQL